MTALDRSKVVSSFTIIKGALVQETYQVLSQWDLELSKKANLDRLRDNNYIGARSSTWLRDVAKVLNRRLDPEGRDLPLVVLARGGCPLDEWRPIYLWHLTRDEFLVRDFLITWLYEAFDEGVYRIRPDDLHVYLQSLEARGGQIEHEWRDVTLARVATGLLRVATDFGLLRGVGAREFAGYHLPERSFLYLMHAILEHEGSPRRAVESLEWRMYLMRESDVEATVLRLHQFRQVQYEVAGSIAHLSLPSGSATAYAESMVA